MQGGQIEQMALQPEFPGVKFKRRSFAEKQLI